MNCVTLSPPPEPCECMKCLSVTTYVITLFIFSDDFILSFDDFILSCLKVFLIHAGGHVLLITPSKAKLLLSHTLVQ